MKKKITLSELAKLCGCSSATVSYVLNGREDQRISEATKEKILQMANLYQYNINSYAQALATGTTNTILLFYEDNDFSFAKADTLCFINDLSLFLDKNNLKLIIAPNTEIKRYSNVDAIITYRVSIDTFNKLSTINYSPIIAIDTLVTDSLFYCINNDYDFLSDSKDIKYAAIPFGDEELNTYLKNKFNIDFISSFSDLMKLINSNYDNIVTFSHELSLVLKFTGKNVKYLNLNTSSKFNEIVEAIHHAINHDETNHKIKI